MNSIEKRILYDFLRNSMNNLDLETKITEISHQLYKIRKRYPIIPYISKEIETFFKLASGLDDQSLFWLQFFIFNNSFPLEELKIYFKSQKLPVNATTTKSVVSLLDELNLLEKNHDVYHMRYSITPFNGYYFFSDFPRILDFMNSDSHRDESTVYTPMIDSFDLATQLRVKEGDKVLDLCTGTGIQAFMESKYASSIIASDINQRAVSLASENVFFNIPQHPNLKKISFRQGSLFDPIPETNFDFISANLPSLPYLPVQTFGNALYGVGGGSDGLDLFRAFIKNLSDKLADRGVAQIWGIFPFDGVNYNFEEYIPDSFKYSPITTRIYNLSQILQSQKPFTGRVKDSVNHYHKMRYEEFHELILIIRKSSQS